jgi:TetR/AcrR family transcriptional regulator, mexJK operon transcriptional repressor
MVTQPDFHPDSESPKRTAILAAAGDLFVKHGYGAVSMDSVARAASVSKATLYAHFASKDALFATIIHDACRLNIAADTFLPEAGDGLAAGLKALGGRLLRFLLEDRTLAIYRVVVAESVRFPELGQAFFENGPDRFHRLFSQWIARQSEAGRLATPDPGMAADQFVGMLRTGLYLRATLGIPPLPAEEAIDRVVNEAVATFLRAYAPKAADQIVRASSMTPSAP